MGRSGHRLRSFHEKLTTWGRGQSGLEPAFVQCVGCRLASWMGYRPLPTRVVQWHTFPGGDRLVVTQPVARHNASAVQTGG